LGGCFYFILVVVIVSILVFGWVCFFNICGIWVGMVFKIVGIWVGVFFYRFLCVIYLRRCYCFAFGIWVGMVFKNVGIWVGGFFVIFGIWVGRYFNNFGIWVGGYFNMFGIWVGGYLESKWHTPVGICGSDPTGNISKAITHISTLYCLL
jgi:hypothetical protein